MVPRAVLNCTRANSVETPVTTAASGTLKPDRTPYQNAATCHARTLRRPIHTSKTETLVTPLNPSAEINRFLLLARAAAETAADSCGAAMVRGSALDDLRLGYGLEALHPELQAVAG